MLTLLKMEFNFGSDWSNYLRQVYIEKIANQFEVELHWKVLEIEKQKKEILMARVNKKQEKVEILHAPHCPCSRCPQERAKVEYQKLLKEETEDEIIYRDFYTFEHMLFCKCSKCKKRNKKFVYYTKFYKNGLRSNLRTMEREQIEQGAQDWMLFVHHLVFFFTDINKKTYY